MLKVANQRQTFIPIQICINFNQVPSNLIVDIYNLFIDGCYFTFPLKIHGLDQLRCRVDGTEDSA